MTTQTQHTAGPWRPEKAGVYDANGQCVCRRHPEAEREWTANARLIAAAPALLAACEAATQQLVDLHAAIADMELGGRFVDDSINMLSEGQTAITAARAALALARGEGAGK